MPIQRSKMIQLIARETSGRPTKVGFYLDDTTHRQRDLGLPHAGGDLPPVLSDHTESRSRLPHAGGDLAQPVTTRTPNPFSCPTPVEFYQNHSHADSDQASLPRAGEDEPVARVSSDSRNWQTPQAQG